jgi:hypothetical protein
MSDVSASVWMATYSGHYLLFCQLRSILEKLADDDELIVCDDA